MFDYFCTNTFVNNWGDNRSDNEWGVNAVKEPLPGGRAVLAVPDKHDF